MHFILCLCVEYIKTWEYLAYYRLWNLPSGQHMLVNLVEKQLESTLQYGCLEDVTTEQSEVEEKKSV